MDFIQAIILGIIEGITEFLPISSTGHLILASDFLGIEHTEFVKTFEISIQSGAILSVVVLYWKTIINDLSLIKRVLVAFIPTAILGFLAYPFIKAYLLGNPQVVLWALFLGGIALIATETIFKKSKKDEKENHPELSYKKAAAIGLFQSIAMIPGVSRSAATIIGGMSMGLSRKQAVEFSFLLAIPTMFAATALDLRETSFLFTASEWNALAVGFITSFIVAIFAIKWFLKYVATNNFVWFGVYRIILAVLYFLFILN